MNTLTYAGIRAAGYPSGDNPASILPRHDEQKSLCCCFPFLRKLFSPSAHPRQISESTSQGGPPATETWQRRISVLSAPADPATISNLPERLAPEHRETAAALSQLLHIHILRLIQSGAQGSIYQGVDDSNGEFAIKIMTGSVRFRRELSGLILPEHPNIATVFHLLLYDPDYERHLTVSKEKAHLTYRFDPTLQLKAVVSQLVPGRDLGEALSYWVSPGPRLAMVIIGQLVQALKHCHANNVLHRDLKPENVLLSPDGGVRLVDFGLADQLHPNGRRYSVLGSPSYVAPEIVYDSGHRFNRLGHSFPLDAWGLGVVLCIALTGTSLDRLLREKGDTKILRRAAARGGISNLQHCIYPVRLAEMDDQQKKELIFNAIPVRARMEPGLSELLELVVGLTKKSPPMRLTLAEVEQKLQQEPFSGVDWHGNVDRLQLSRIPATVSVSHTYSNATHHQSV